MRYDQRGKDDKKGNGQADSATGGGFREGYDEAYNISKKQIKEK
jgi:hypothetical protein